MTTATAERPRYQINLDPLAEIGELYRRWSANIAEFRAEIDAVRSSRILELHMPDGPEARRRRGLLAPLAAPQPGPYRELAPANLDAEHEAAKRARQQRKAMGWTPNVPEGAGPTSILPAVELPAAEKAEMVREVKAAFRRIQAPEAEPDGWVEATRLRRVLAWIGAHREKWRQR